MRDDRQGEGTERMCVVSREVKPVADLLRFVADPFGAVVPDLKRNLPGRGVWVSARAESVREAVRRKMFPRALKAPVTADAGLDTQVEALLRRRASGALALANKAGEVVTGFAKVEEALRGARAVALLHAREAGADGIEKLARVARRTRPDLPVFTMLDGGEIDLALGRSNVIHAALVAGRASAQALERCLSLAHYRGDGAGLDRPLDRSPDAPTPKPAGPTAA